MWDWFSQLTYLCRLSALYFCGSPINTPTRGFLSQTDLALSPVRVVGNHPIFALSLMICTRRAAFRSDTNVTLKCACCRDAFSKGQALNSKPTEGEQLNDKIIRHDSSRPLRHKRFGTSPTRPGKCDNRSADRNDRSYSR